MSISWRFLLAAAPVSPAVAMSPSSAQAQGSIFDPQGACGRTAFGREESPACVITHSPALISGSWVISVRVEERADRDGQWAGAEVRQTPRYIHGVGHR